MKTINQSVLNLIFSEFMKIVADEEIEIAFEVYGNNKPLLYYSHPALSKDKENWITRKRNVVNTFSQSSLEIAEKNNHNLQSFCNKYGYSAKDFAMVAGSVPIFNEYSDLIGILTVTGLQPQEDHDLALSVLNKVKNQ